MTSIVDICNRALQTIGTRTNVTQAELTNGSTNEAIQFNLIYENLRDDLLRLAPWDCAYKTANLVYITSSPGTPENQSPATNLWQPGQPAPPWAYEYQYPADCLRAVRMIPANQTGFASGVPITTAVTGGSNAFWQGGPIVFKVQIDYFYTISTVAIITGGANYTIGDQITLDISSGSDGVPPGAAAILEVTAASGGAVTAARVVNQITGSDPPKGGSYFKTNYISSNQASSTGPGTGAQFTPQGVVGGDQRVILCNQEFATLQYVKQITDPNLMDTLFQTAWINLIAAGLCMALKGDRGIANDLIAQVNAAIEQARSIDGNEGLTINDVTPDWERIRGVAWNDGYMSGPYSGYDWGGVWPMYL